MDAPRRRKFSIEANRLLLMLISSVHAKPDLVEIDWEVVAALLANHGFNDRGMTPSACR